jgi:subtilase family serine protease
MMVQHHKRRAPKMVAIVTLILLMSFFVGGPFYFHAHAAGPSLYAQLVSRHFRLLGSGPDGLSTQCPDPQTLACYTPAQLANAYSVQPLYQQGITGAGRTIVIVDGSQDPSIQSDLQKFDQMFNLPDPPAPVQIFFPQGEGTPNPGVATEITLDVEGAHELAPGANIDLVLANTDNARTITDIVQRLTDAATYAIDKNLGDVLTMSISEDERCVPASLQAEMNTTFASAAQKGISVLAASGDDGASNFTCDASTFFSTPGVGLPASNPNVTAVGGTFLQTDGAGSYQAESAWTQASTNGGATGGGFSGLYSKPAYQQGVPSIDAVGKRAIPDIALVADPASGVLFFCTYCNRGAGPVTFSEGGTSVSTPLWAGIVALGDQLAGHRLGSINPALYKAQC